MRIAVITLEFPPAISGIAEYLGQLTAHLGAGGHEVAVWAPPALPARPGDSPEAPPYQRHVIPTSFRKLILALRRWHPDRIIVGHTDLRLLLAARLVAAQHYMTIAYGNDFLGVQRLWYHGLVNHLLANSRPLVAISRHTAGRLQALGIPNPVVIYPGTDPKRFSPPQVPPPPPYILLSVGRLVPRKGIDVAMRALAHLQQLYPDIRYRVAGRGPERPALQQLARALDIEDRVEFLGAVPADDLPELYRQAHLFVLPLRAEEQANSVESFGMVFLEAAATAIPSVAGNSGGAAEAVQDGVTGLVVPPGDVAAVREAIRALLANDEQRQEMGRNGRRWVEEEMNWKRVVQDVYRWLE